MANKMNFALEVLLVLAPLAFSVPALPADHYHEYKPVYYSPPKYEYSYGVHDDYTGDIKTAHESRSGGVTKGSYSVLQPDGILRTVNYVADPWNGFQATVTNKGYSHHHRSTHHTMLPAPVPVVPVVVPVPKSIVLKTPMRPLAHPYRRTTTTTAAPPPPPHDDEDHDGHHHDHHDYVYETHNVVYE